MPSKNTIFIIPEALKARIIQDSKASKSVMIQRSPGVITHCGTVAASTFGSRSNGRWTLVLLSTGTRASRTRTRLLGHQVIRPPGCGTLRSPEGDHALYTPSVGQTSINSSLTAAGATSAIDGGQQHNFRINCDRLKQCDMSLSNLCDNHVSCDDEQTLSRHWHSFSPRSVINEITSWTEETLTTTEVEELRARVKGTIPWPDSSTSTIPTPWSWEQSDAPEASLDSPDWEEGSDTVLWDNTTTPSPRSDPDSDTDLDSDDDDEDGVVVIVGTDNDTTTCDASPDKKLD